MTSFLEMVREITSVAEDLIDSGTWYINEECGKTKGRENFLHALKKLEDVIEIWRKPRYIVYDANGFVLHKNVLVYKAAHIIMSHGCYEYYVDTDGEGMFALYMSTNPSYDDHKCFVPFDNGQKFKTMEDMWQAVVDGGKNNRNGVWCEQVSITGE